MGEPESEALLRRLRSDDVAALDEILQRHWPAVLGYLARWLGSRDAAEDVAQRAFLRLWERRHEWRPEGSLRALLFSIARHLAISDHRSRDARDRAQARFLHLTPASAPPDAADSIASRELGRALDAAIARLPERRREIFVLRCVHDLPYAEIATLLGISQQTVANQLSRALATLRGELAHLLERP